MTLGAEIRRLLGNLENSRRGWAACWRTEKSVRQWSYVNIVSALLVFALPLSAAERALLLALGLLVIAVELVNTAIEAVVDLASPDHHPLAGLAKDCASAAVVVLALAGALAWLLILIG